MLKFTKYLFVTTCFTGPSVFAVDAGSNSTSLDAAIEAANIGPNITIDFTQNVFLTNQVRAVNADPTFTYVGQNITVAGNNFQLFGSNTTRGLFAGGFNATIKTGSVKIKNLNFTQCAAIGGNGGDAGGGGMGAGGGLFVGQNVHVILSNCTFSNNKAIGGNGGLGTASNCGGGGGLHGHGGGSVVSAGGGGGFGGNGADAVTTTIGGGGGGASGFTSGNASGSSPGLNFDGTGASGSGGVGGSGDTSTSLAQNGGFGGGGGGGANNSGGGPIGGDGNFYGGGGGGSFRTTADGGPGGLSLFGGGGGGGGSAAAAGSTGGTAGSSVFGGGGGGGGSGTFSGPGASGGFGGGNGTNGASVTGGKGGTGGNGAGFGGAIFIEQGGILTILHSVRFKENSAAAGTGGIANTDPTAGFGALGQDIFMMSQSTLNFDISSNVNLKKPIQGNQGKFQNGTPPEGTHLGGLVKNGHATLILTGANTYTGTTNINKGSLVLNGSTTSNVNVEPNGKFSGKAASILKNSQNKGGNLTNKGFVKIGQLGTNTISVAGNYTQTKTGKLKLGILPNGKSDKLNIAKGGKVKLDGELIVFVNKGKYIPHTEYKIINAPTNGTRFSRLSTVGPGANQVSLEIQYSSVFLIVEKPSLFAHHHIQSGIPTEVALCFDKDLDSSADHTDVFTALNRLNNSELNDTLVSMSPVNFGNVEWINARNNSYVADILSQHLFQLCCSPRDCSSCDPCCATCNTSVWITGFGNFMDNRKRFDNLNRFDANGGGILAGIDWCFGPEFFIGGSIGYTHTGFKWHDKGHGNLNSYYGALYGSWNTCDSFTVDASVIGGGTEHEFRRKIEFASIDRTAKSHPWAGFVTAHLGFRTDWNWCCTEFEPFALVDYHYFHRNHIREHGAESLDLRVKAKTQHLMRTEVGLNAYWTWVCLCSCFSPYLGLSWVGEFPLNKSKQKASFADINCLMVVKSYHDMVNLASPQAGLKWTFTDGFSFILGYKGLFSKKTVINQADLRFEWIY